MEDLTYNKQQISWTCSFREKIILNFSTPETRIGHGIHVFLGSRWFKEFWQEDLTYIICTNNQIIWEEKILKASANQKQELLMVAMFFGNIKTKCRGCHKPHFCKFGYNWPSTFRGDRWLIGEKLTTMTDAKWWQ